MSLYTSDNPVFATFSFYAALLGAKTLCMAFLTGRQRFRKMVSLLFVSNFLTYQLTVHLQYLKAFANPEDAKMNKGKIKTDDDVERVRR